MPNIMPLSEVRKRLSSLVQELERPIWITQYGRARAVLIDAKQFDEILEQMEDLRLACDAEHQARLARIREWTKDEASLRAAEERGDLIPWEKVKAELEAQDGNGGVPG